MQILDFWTSLTLLSKCSQAKREFKKYTKNVKPGMKAKDSIADQFFMYLSWLRNGFTITIISRLFHISKSSVFSYHMDKFTLFSLGSIVICPSKNQVSETRPKHSNLYTLLVDALKTAAKYFVKIPHYCPLKEVATEGISNMSQIKVAFIIALSRATSFFSEFYVGSISGRNLLGKVSF